MKNDEIAIKVLALVPDLVRHAADIGRTADVGSNRLDLRLAAGAPASVLREEDEQGPNYPIYAGFVGAGAMLACAWVSLGMPGSKEELVELSVGPLTVGWDGPAPVSPDQCRAMFHRGFEWFMTQSESRQAPDGTKPTAREI
ncbi:hypothetical protein CJO09_03865 [Neopusillimonas maritima]|uniref:Uncharacterized protein n=1 Tax=Neopusillimonas maritima TaxID=2026239 RepID=A0ABX9MZH7_9BURK|nr:hypothetical protein CJO09_03865 [Neopusillimonas maritima]